MAPCQPNNSVKTFAKQMIFYNMVHLTGEPVDLPNEGFTLFC